MVTLRADAVEFGYEPGQRVLAGIDVTLVPGELLAILGPNGSGKSTLLRLLAGLRAPQQGSVTLDGAAVAALPAHARARAIAVVPQLLRALPGVTVAEFVAGGRYAHLGGWRIATAADRDAVEQALARTDVAAWRTRLLHELSGGERQRVFIARALAQQAAVLLADEPTTSLDLDHQLATMALLGSLARDGHAVLVVTHDLNLASQFADRILLLAAGRIVAAGTPREVLRAEVLVPVYGPGVLVQQFPASGLPLVVAMRQDRGTP